VSRIGEQLSGLIEPLEHIALTLHALLGVGHRRVEYGVCQGFDEANEVLKCVDPDPAEYPLFA